MRFFKGLLVAIVISIPIWIVLVLAATKAFGAPVDECRFQHIDKAVWTQQEEERTARCVLKRFGPIAGGFPQLDQVATCESGWSRLARSSSSSYLGLFQHSELYWSGRVAVYEPAHWTLSRRWQNSRSQLTVTVRMVRAEGWSPWVCA
jgi:hypothetical protein